MSKAYSGKGTTLGIGATPTLIGELKTFKFSGQGNTVEDTTNSDSVGRAREFITTLYESGSMDFSGNYFSSDAGQAAVQTALASGAITSFTLQLPKSTTQSTTGDKYVFNAVLDKWNLDVQFDKSISYSATLKISGLMTFTVGS